MIHRMRRRGGRARARKRDSWWMIASCTGMGVPQRCCERLLALYQLCLCANIAQLSSMLAGGLAEQALTTATSIRGHSRCARPAGRRFGQAPTARAVVWSRAVSNRRPSAAALSSAELSGCRMERSGCRC